MLAIENVQNMTPQVNASGPIKVVFQVTGAVALFTFPFSNESLTEKMIVFVKQDT